MAEQQFYAEQPQFDTGAGMQFQPQFDMQQTQWVTSIRILDTDLGQ